MLVCSILFSSFAFGNSNNNNTNFNVTLFSEYKKILQNNKTLSNKSNYSQNKLHTYASNNNLVYQKPNTFDFFFNIGNDYSKAYDIATSKENLDMWALIVGSTALFMYYDDEFINESKKVGDKIGVAPEQGMHAAFSVGPYPVIQFPLTGSSALYWIGDGAVHIGIMAGFLTHGAIYDDSKTLSVGSQLLEGLFDITITTQIIKHITGHESPNQASEPRGRWRWFPNQDDYAQNVEKYDAFPSGHLATTTMTVTVLSENYPDNVYIKPIGYTAMALLSFQMMNNGVHWMSDYPLAIGIGYTFGRIVSNREKAKAKIFGKNISFKPLITSNGLYGIVGEYKF
jgi:hypothetical protein